MNVLFFHVNRTLLTILPHDLLTLTFRLEHRFERMEVVQSLEARMAEVLREIKENNEGLEQTDSMEDLEESRF